jgi:hypothetical protein
MKKLFYYIATLLVLLNLSGCGTSDSSPSSEPTTQEDTTTEDTFVLSDSLKSSLFYVVKDNTKSNFTLQFDQNLSSWQIVAYDNNYSTSLDTVDANISVEDDKIIDTNGILYFTNHTDQYLNFTTRASSLTKLKMFSSIDDALSYQASSLKDILPSNIYYGVQNNSTNRSLYKFEFADTLDTWDVSTYNGDFSDDNISSTYYNLNVDVEDTNLTDSGGTVYHFNSLEEKYISLVNSVNQLHTVKLYTNPQDALEYYSSFDLRTKLKDTTIYAVSNNGTDKTLITLEFTTDLTNYSIGIYEDNYDTPLQTGTQNSIIQEDRFTDSTDTIIVQEVTDTYIELKGIINTTIFRFYFNPTDALEYYNQ